MNSNPTYALAGYSEPCISTGPLPPPNPILSHSVPGVTHLSPRRQAGAMGDWRTSDWSGAFGVGVGVGLTPSGDWNYVASSVPIACHAGRHA